MKSYVPDHTPVFTELPTPLQMDVAELFPQEILDRRLVKKANAAYLQVLIKWSMMPASMVTWEDYDVLQQRFPGATAWGQAVSQGGTSVAQGASRVEPDTGDTPSTSASSDEVSGN